jgi:hypothetical protein
MRFRTREQKVKADGTLDGYRVIEPAYPHPGWEGNTLETDASASGNERYVHLDHQYEQLAAGGWVAFEAPGETPRGNAFTISGKSTRVRVSTSGLASFPMRTTTIHVQSERLPLAPLRITQTVSGNTLVCDRMLLGVRVGQMVANRWRSSSRTSIVASASSNSNRRSPTRSSVRPSPSTRTSRAPRTVRR